MEREGFVDIETPILWKPTPEGARDFVVPSRLQPGKFYALPQSPQIAKQLLVISGFERYYQIARCFRDEDPRADRLQELTQLDVEMAFPDREFLFALMERIVERIWRECIGVELEAPFQRMTYDEAMLRFGIDRPDLRFGMEIQEATEATRGSEFGVFANAPCVRYIAVPKEFSRTEVQALENQAKSWGAKGLAYLVFREDGEVSSPIAKFLDDGAARALARSRATRCSSSRTSRASSRRCSACCACSSAASSTSSTSRSGSSSGSSTCPSAEWDEQTGALDRGAPPVHAADRRQHRDLQDRPGRGARGRVRPRRRTGSSSPAARSGSTSRGSSSRSSRTSASAPEEQREKFGFLLDALAMGAPPHGGIASGIDRLMMALLNEPYIRDTQAFPKNQVGLRLHDRGADRAR